MQRDAGIIRHEQVEKIAKAFCRVPCVANKERINCDKLCEIYSFAFRAYNAGYRKADDVRKETAKEFAEKVKAHAERCYEWDIAKIVCAEVDIVLKEYKE